MYMYNIYIYVYTYTYTYTYVDELQKPHCDVTGTMVSKGNHPQMGLVKLVSAH